MVQCVEPDLFSRVIFQIGGTQKFLETCADSATGQDDCGLWSEYSKGRLS